MFGLDIPAALGRTPCLSSGRTRMDSLVAEHVLQDCRSHTGYLKCTIVSCVKTVYKEFHVKYAVNCVVFGDAHCYNVLSQHGYLRRYSFLRARLGLVPSNHTDEGPVMSKLKQGAATVSCS